MSDALLTQRALAHRLERAQAVQNERLNQAAGGRSLAVGGGFAHFRGEGHPLNQALGLTGPVSEAELQAVEEFLGSPTVLELGPGADPGLWPLLARRGYRVHTFQQLWTRGLTGPLPARSSAEVRLAESGEARRFSQVVNAAFMDRDDWQGHEPLFAVPLDQPGIVGFLALVGDEPAGGGVLGMIDGVGLLSGDGVLPKFRGRGLQKALIGARLAHAAAHGCDLACASTASQRSYEACGFRVAYPKLELALG